MAIVKIGLICELKSNPEAVRSAWESLRGREDDQVTAKIAEKMILFPVCTPHISVY